MNIIAAKYNTRARAVDSLLCVGLDPVLAQMPGHFRRETAPLFAFCRHIVDQTAPYVAAFKPNTAFFEAHGSEGIAQLERTCDYIRAHHPGILLICDAKRADIGNTNHGYVAFAFDQLACDAITLHPYLGREALEPFLERSDKACLILCRNSNPGAGEFQDLALGSDEGKPLWQHVAEHVAQQWDRDCNCMLVVGATYPDEMRRLRALAPHTIFLVPGIGTQGGDITAVIDAGLDAMGGGLILSASRSVLYAADPAAAAREARDGIRRAIEAKSEVMLAAR